jgi:hypothetical protein
VSAPHEHPIPRVAHALLDVHRILLGIEDRRSAHGQPSRMDASEARRLILEMIDDHAAIAQYVERQEQNIATMIQESNEREREVTRLQREKADVVDALESMLRMNAARLDSITTERRALQALYQRLVGPIRPMGVVHAESTTEPLRAAGA